MEDNLCPRMEKALQLLSKKWNGLIVFSLLTGINKFSELEKYITGISARMLTERLKELESEGIVKKNVYPETPIRIEYELTKKGIDLGETYKQIGLWAEKWN